MKKLSLPVGAAPIVQLDIPADIELYIKREDLVHPSISGNKYWKLFHNINRYADRSIPDEERLIITFGGAFSNHISALASFGAMASVKTIGVIRGEELKNSSVYNPTLSVAIDNGMELHFVSREEYRDKEALYREYQTHFAAALIIPEGGSNATAVEGIGYMLGPDTKEFKYLCAAVGTGGTVAGLSRFAGDDQKVIGFGVVKDSALPARIRELGARDNLELKDAAGAGYGKINDEDVRFINAFQQRHGIPLDPVYTGKMMRKLISLADDGFFAKGSKVLAFHTGGLQGIAGANDFLRQKQRPIINYQI